ncbi:hypothetical protein GGS24DRAFT_512560 [Hypoxylon argillaceum]|nr:hypothetical protein GGS24DRAFT_512560 [Hypoxylon argillaceum]
MAFILPATLAGNLTDREAITDALYRAVLAFDHNDEALLLSAITPDLEAKMPGAYTEGIDEFKAAAFNRVAKHNSTHFLSSIRIDIQSNTTAQATCTVVSQHVCPDEDYDPTANKFSSGGMYRCDLVKVDNLWKIRKWVANYLWVDGDPTVTACE